MITFTEFCDRQFLGGKDREDFRAWLKNKAYTSRYELEWKQLFNQWMKSSLDKVLI